MPAAALVLYKYIFAHASCRRPQGRSRGAHLRAQRPKASQESGLRPSLAFGALSHCLCLPTKRRRRNGNGGQAQCMLSLGKRLVLAMLLCALRRRAPVPHCEDGTGAPRIPPSLHVVHVVPTEPLAHTPQPRQDFDPRHQTRHPGHRDIHCTTTDAMAWARVSDAGDAAAEATI
jgi:hypothetical protein